MIIEFNYLLDITGSMSCVYVSMFFMVFSCVCPLLSYFHFHLLCLIQMEIKMNNYLNRNFFLRYLLSCVIFILIISSVYNFRRSGKIKQFQIVNITIVPWLNLVYKFKKLIKLKKLYSKHILKNTIPPPVLGLDTSAENFLFHKKDLICLKLRFIRSGKMFSLMF